VQAGLWAGGALLAALVAGAVLVETGASPVLVALPGLAWLPFFALSVFALPRLAYRRWRFGIDDEEIDLQRGRVWVERVLVPMARVQHVDTGAGPLQRRLGLASVWVHTAAGAFEIPALDAERARDLRVRIARLAHVSDEL